MEVEEGMEEGKGSKFEPCWDPASSRFSLMYNIMNCFEHIPPLECTEAKGDLIRPGFEK